MEANDQEIQTILLGFPEDIYVVVDSCETAQEIWLRVQQMMNGPDIGIQDKKAKLFNEWERLTSTDGESIESYYHRFLKLMNDFKRNKHFLVKIATARVEGNAIGNNGYQIRCYNCTGLGHLARNYTQASTSGTQTDKALVYDSNSSAEVHNYNNCYDNEIFNMFTQEGHYTDLIEPTSKPHQVQPNESNVIFEVSSMEQDGRTVDQHLATVEETSKFVQDFKSLAKEANESLAKHKALELKIKRLLRAVVSQDIMSIVQNNSVVDTSNLQTEFERLPKIDETHSLSKPVTSNSIPTPQESKVMKNDNVIAPAMFRINPFKPSREEKYVPNKVRASVRTNPITVSQPHVITKKDVNSDSNGLFSIRGNNTAKTRRPQPRSNTKNDKVPSASKSSCSKNKKVEVEEHPRNLLLSKNMKHMSSECNNVKLAIQNDKSKVVCAMCKQCLITTNHDVCVLNYVNDMNSYGKKHKENVLNTKNQKKQKPTVMKPKKVGSNERLASPKPSKPRSCLRWSPTGRLFDLERKIITSSKSESQSDCSNGNNACTSNPPEPTIKRNLKLLINFAWKFLGTVRFGNDHVASILGFEVAFKRNTCFVRNYEGVNLLKGNRTTNLYTINLHEMASAYPICLMARETSTKSWLWHQQLADLITKALLVDRFNYLVRRLGYRVGGSNTLSWKPCQGGSSKLNLPDHRDKWRRYNLIPAKSRFKTSCLIKKDEYMMKAQVHVSSSCPMGQRTKGNCCTHTYDHGIRSLMESGKPWGNNKVKGKSKLAYAPKPKIPPPPKKEDPAKDSVCHHCGDICHWKRNCPIYLSELLKNKKPPQGVSTSGIFTIKLFTFPGKSWVYNTGCATHICSTTQGFKKSRKLKPGALSLSTRTRHAPDRMCLNIEADEYELGDLNEPANYKAALLDTEFDKWPNAMNVEMKSMKDNEVWDLFNLPPNSKTVGSKWLSKKKTDMDGDVQTYKARFIVKGFIQTPQN
uniref:CCHC-type domain-containing protein n=1 Tax=Tanacetum cinerariifolium TaxID=118510 RepID=A0A6L2NE75_TANCI|nr:hypothetical protein [Tanacetum cinerariifolium]